MGSLFQATAVFNFRQAFLQLNAIHNLSPSLLWLKFLTAVLAPLSG
jgi:hypothetical protein